MIEFLCQLIDPLMTVIKNRNYRRKQRWEHIMAPIFKQLTEFDSHYESVLKKAMLSVMVINNVLAKNESEEKISLKRMRIKQYDKLLAQLWQKIWNEVLSIGRMESKIMLYKILYKKGKLSEEERSFLKVVLDYFSTINQNNHTINKTSHKSNPLINCASNLSAEHILNELQSAINLRIDLYEIVCEKFSQLQLKVLEIY